MRVVGGEWRSRRIEAPQGGGVRPTSDRLRETLFNILGPAVAGAAFVDGFAGTGAVGMEAFSRGARPVVWVEAAAPALRVLRRNLDALGAGADPAVAVLARRLPGAIAALAELPVLREAGGASFLFLDPPYADTEAPERCLLALALHPEVMAPGGRVIVETRAGARLLAEKTGRWRLQRLHRQGESQLAFFAAEY